MRKIRFEEKFAEYERQERELARRTEETADAEAKRKLLKEKRRMNADRSRRAVIERKRLQGLGAGSLDALDDDVEMPDDEKAAIQIQRAVRGKLGKVHVAVRRRVFNDAALQLQRVRRGKAARDRIVMMKLQESAVLVIQRRSRGLLDRRKVAQLKQAKLVHVSARLLQSTFRRHTGAARMQKRREFVAAKKSILRSAQQLYPSYLAQLKEVEEPAPLLLVRTLQCVMILLNRTVKPDPSEGITWATLLDFLDSEQFLPSVRRLAHDGYRETLALPRALIAQVEVFFHDPNFSVQEVAKIRPGGKACALLLEWVRAALALNTLTPLFADAVDLAASAVYWDNAAEVLELERKQRERVPKTYIVDGVLPEQPARPRPVIVCMARDVPFDRKERLVAQLQEMLPDVFVRVNVPVVDMALLQQTLDVGKSIVLDIDMGNSQQHRRRFVAQAELIRKTLTPTPLMIAVEGERANRHGGGAAVKFGVGRDDSMLMQDWELKSLLEDAAEQLFLLNLDSNIGQLQALGQQVVNAPPELVLLFEAAMITLTPQHRFQTPTETSPLVTWPAARKMLADASTFVRRLAMVDSDALPLQNLLVLQAYRNHPRWPTEATIPGGKGAPPFLLMKLLDDVVEYATALDRAGGPPAPVVTKGGTFGAALRVADTVDLTQQFVQLITPALRDMKIYAQAHRINRQHLVISVFRDCRKFIFVAYDPKSGLQYHTTLPEDEADVLLAPNSVENASDPRPPPETLTELCARLTELLQLELEPLPKGVKVKKAAKDRKKQLWLRRKLVRLTRASQKIGPVLTTVTASEARRGEIQLDVYVPSTSKTYRLTVTEEDLLKIEADALEDAGAELEAVRSRDPFKIAKHVIDRLEFRRGQLRLRVTGGGGRRLLEAGIVLNGVRVVASIYYSDTAGVRLQVYVPTASQSFRFYLSPREMKDLLGDCSLSGKMVWQQLLLKRLSVQNKTRVLFDRCLYKESVNVDGIFMTVECCALGPDGGIELVAYRNDTSQVWSLAVSDDELNDVIVTDDERRQGVKVWPARVEDIINYNKICSRMPAALSWDVGAADDGTARAAGVVLQFGGGVASATARGDNEADTLAEEKATKEAQAASDAGFAPSSAQGTAGAPSSAERLAAANAAATNISSAQDSSKSTASHAEAKAAANKAKTEAFRRGRLLCSFAFKHSALGGRIVTCSGYDDDDLDGELRLVVYDSQQASGAACALASFEVQRAVGQRLELLTPERRYELAEYLLRERLEIVPADSEAAKRKAPVGQYATDGVFAVRMKLARVYSQTRVTPFPAEGQSDRTAQLQDSTVVTGGVSRRGRKVLTVGTRLDTHRVVVTAFAVEHPPQLRFSAYLPEMSLKFAVADSSESVAAEVAACAKTGADGDARMKALAQERVEQLALSYAADTAGRPVGIRLLPRDELKAREALEALEAHRVAAGGLPLHGGRRLQGEARQLLRQGVRLQGLKLVLTVWGDVVQPKKKFGAGVVDEEEDDDEEDLDLDAAAQDVKAAEREKRRAAKKAVAQPPLEGKDVRKFWAVVEDPASGQAADCDVPVEAVLSQTAGSVEPHKLLRIRRLLVAKRRGTAEGEADQTAENHKVQPSNESEDQPSSGGATGGETDSSPIVPKVASEEELSLRYAPTQLLRRLPFVLGKKWNSPPCLLRVSVRADILHVELCSVGSNSGAAVLLVPSESQPTLGLLSTAERLQLATVLMTTIKEAVASGSFDVARMLHVDEDVTAAEDQTDQAMDNASQRARLQTQFDGIYADVMGPMLESADNTILFAAFERFEQDRAAERASEAARVQATADGLDRAAIEAAAATAATAAAVQVVTTPETQMPLQELTKFLDVLDWAGFYAADCFKFLDLALDDVVSFSEFRRWQEFAWESRRSRRGPSKRALLEAYREQYLSGDADDDAAALAAARREDILSDDEDDAEEEGANVSQADLAAAQDVARSYLDGLYSRLEGGDENNAEDEAAVVAAASSPSAHGANSEQIDHRRSRSASPTALSEVDLAILRKAFNEIDSDGGGSLSRAELGQFLAKLAWTNVTVDDAFEFLDRPTAGEEDEDQRISFDEFVRWRQFAWTNRALTDESDGGPAPPALSGPSRNLARSSTGLRSLNRFNSKLEGLGEGDEEGDETLEEEDDEGHEPENPDSEPMEQEDEQEQEQENGEEDTEEDPKPGPDGEVRLPESSGDGFPEEKAVPSDADKYSALAVDADPSLNVLDSDMNAVLYLNELYSEVTLPADETATVER